MAETPKKTTDEEFVKELLALRYDGELSAEEMKQMLRDSHRFGERNIKHSASFAWKGWWLWAGFTTYPIQPIQESGALKQCFPRWKHKMPKHMLFDLDGSKRI